MARDEFFSEWWQKYYELASEMVPEISKDKRYLGFKGRL